MSPAYVRTIGEEIFYEYAKLISRSARDLLLEGKALGNGPLSFCLVSTMK